MLYIFYHFFFKKSRITILHVYFRAVAGTEAFLNMKEAERRVQEEQVGSKNIYLVQWYMRQETKDLVLL